MRHNKRDSDVDTLDEWVRGEDYLDSAVEGPVNFKDHDYEDDVGDDDGNTEEEDYVPSTSSRHLKRKNGRRQGRNRTDDDDGGGDDDDNQIAIRSPPSAKESTTVLRKLDTRLTLTLCLLYLLSFLDRSNIGNARVAGLQNSLSLTSPQFDRLLLAFYATYILFEPMILLYRIVPASLYIPLCVFSWGIVACMQATVTNFKQLLGCRALLGITEAAFGPGVPFYMTFFYRREELAYRVGLQISAAPLATAGAGALAWVVLKANEVLSGKSGIEGWRALFLVEGFPSIVVAAVAWYTGLIPDGPATARWLTPRERQVAVMRLKQEKDAAEETTSRRSRRRPSWSAKLASTFGTLADPKAWLLSLMMFSVNISFASLPVFLPTIIRDMSFSPLTSQILAAPPYLVAFAYVLFVSNASDRIKDSRGLFLMLSAALSATSYAVIAVIGILASRGVSLANGQLGIWIRYIAVYGAAVGLFGSVVLVITWQLNNQRSVAGKGMAMVILNVVGQTGPLVGVRLFPDGDAPFFVGGMTVCAVSMGCVVLLSLGLRIWLARLNGKMMVEKEGNGAGEVEGRGRYEMVGLVGGSNEGMEAEGEDDNHEDRGGGGGGGVTTSVFRYML